LPDLELPGLTRKQQSRPVTPHASFASELHPISSCSSLENLFFSKEEVVRGFSTVLVYQGKHFAQFPPVFGEDQMNENSVEKCKKSELGYMHHPLGDMSNTQDTFTHLTGRLQMHPSYENTSPDDLEFRFKTLMHYLIGYNPAISPDDVLDLHWWMIEQQENRPIAAMVEATLGVQSRKEQIAICKRLVKCASAIAEQFDFFNQLTPLDSLLSKNYTALTRRHPELQASSPLPSGVQPWDRFRDDLRAHTTLLVKVAREVQDQVKEQSSKKGRPPQAWKNETLTELVARLSSLVQTTQGERIFLAVNVWKNYFQDDEIDPDELEMPAKRVQRQQNKAKTKLVP
jgi:hypothetical protein